MVTVKSRQVQTNILIEPQLMQVIEEMAAFEMVSRADIIRRLIRRGLEADPRAAGDSRRSSVHAGAA